MSLLSPEEIASLAPAESSIFPAPIPVQCVSSDEFMPQPQTQKQKEYENRVKAYGAKLAKNQGMARRTFFKSASGMATAFLAMNDTYGPMFSVSEAEAATPEMANERASGLKGQFIMDMHTHFLRDDTKIQSFLQQRLAVGKAGWNPALVDKPQTIDDLKFANYLKEMYLDSDTKVCCISGAPSEIEGDWFLTNDMKANARATINSISGSKRAFAHAIFTPGYDGWMDEIDRAIEVLKPDSFKGYTIGDNTHKDLSKHPWRLDDEKLVYPAYEKFVKAGLKNVCIHKGLFPPSMESKFPHLLNYVNVSDVGKAAKDWPQLNFIIYHGGYRYAGGGKAEDAWEQFEKTGRIDWITDLAEVPTKYGVKNVYADVGQLFAQTTIVDPRLSAVMMGQLIRGLGQTNVVWGTDAIWTGSPQWQIEAFRRLEIPEEIRRRYGYKPLGEANGPVKNAIFGENNARIYNYSAKQRAELAGDKILQAKNIYEKDGPNRTNMSYGYVNLNKNQA
ncbi:amidohydrolase family protein [Polynucleobacter rarus]|jgi:predicted TIM-barrel fold metal-dependent hydrolase|uniref:amidohydrolase family protein n=1 Tax=Polynucleobacter rarus TaxID=556055 RepID=UPI000D3E7CE3|nr:amidohydrolase family protein [Polynucleobacter rarus]